MFDLILSLLMWMIVSATILPVTIDLMKQSQGAKNMNIATALLYNELHRYLMSGEVRDYQVIILNGISYELASNLELREVCVKFANRDQKESKVCEFLE